MNAERDLCRISITSKIALLSIELESSASIAYARNLLILRLTNLGRVASA